MINYYINYELSCALTTYTIYVCYEWVLPACCIGVSPLLLAVSQEYSSPSMKYYKDLMGSRFNFYSCFLFLSISFSFSHLLTHSPSSYVGQSMCIDIFSVYQSPESRIGDHPRNRLSHFYVLQKWSGQVLSSISLSFTGSPPFQPLSRHQWQGTVKNTLGLLQHMMEWVTPLGGERFYMSGASLAIRSGGGALT